MGSQESDGEELISKFILFAKAQREAFAKAGITKGTVQFTCPLCGGNAVATRFRYKGRWAGGSGCEKCGIRSMS